MTNIKNGGGPAFPCLPSKTASYKNGMTLRDWFAGMAMQGMLASPHKRAG